MKILRHWMQKGLRAVARATYHWPKTVCLTAFILTIVSAYLTLFHLGVVNNPNDLIRKDSEAQKYYLELVREFKIKDPMVVVVQSNDFEANRKTVEDLAQRLTPLVEAQKIFEKIYYRNDLSRLRGHALLFEEKPKLEAILGQIRSQAKLLGSRSNRPVDLNSLLDEALRQFDEVEEKRGGEGTLDQLSLFADRMVRDLEKLARDLEKPLSETAEASSDLSPDMAELDRQLLLNSYIMFDEGKTLLMLITPSAGDISSFSPQKNTIQKLREMIADVKKTHPNVSIGLTGEPVLMTEELVQSTEDMIIGSIVAFGLIALLFAFAYHEIIRPALAMVALICALFWSLGFAVITVGHLNIISQAFILMMLGLGIDFGIQILGRYEEEWLKGRGVLHALENTIQHTGLAVVTSGGTTALAFYTMCFNDFLGLSELGLIAGSGMVFAVATSLVFLPALLTWRDKRRHLPKAENRPASFDRGEKIDRLLFSHPRLLVLVGLIITLWMGAMIWVKRVPFDYNLLNLQSQNLESVALARNLSSNFIAGMIVAENMEDARTKTDALSKLPTVRSVQSPVQMLPVDQTEKLNILKEIETELSKVKIRANPAGRLDIARAKRNLNRLLQNAREGAAEAAKYRSLDRRARMADEIFSRMIPSLERALTALNRLSNQEAQRRLGRYQFELLNRIQKEFEFLASLDLKNPVTLEDLPNEARERYISPSGKILIEVFPNTSVWEKEENSRFVADLRSVSPSATGTPVQNDVYIELLVRSYMEAAGYAFLAILVAVSIHFSRLSRIILALIPLIVAIIWTLGTMALLDMPFNPANIVTLPLVIGIGVAYGIYVIDRYSEEGKVHVFTSSTGKAVFLSALTTLIGFGVMIFGHYPGLVSLGKLMSLGIFYCFIAGTFLLPNILLWNKNKK